MTIKWSVLTHIVLLVAARVMSFMSCVCAGAVPVPSVRWELFLLQRVHAVSGEPVGGVLRLCGWAPPLCLQHHVPKGVFTPNSPLGSIFCFKNKRHTCKMQFSNQLHSKAGEKSDTCISRRLSWWDWRRIEAISVPQNSKLRIDFPEIPLLLLLLSTEATQFLMKFDFFSKIFARLFKAIELKT